MTTQTAPNANSELPFAESEQQLRNIFAHSKYASLSPTLSLARYFPRFPQRALGENRMVGIVNQMLYVLAGVIAAVIAYCCVRHAIWPFIVCALISLPTITLLKRLLPRLYAATSESSKFVELICFDDRRPVVYLRRFRSENPTLATVRTRHLATRAALALPNDGQPLENLSDLLASCGPVLGIGCPVDTAIHRRIYRLFVADDHWRATVKFLLAEAKAVFLHYEPGEFLEWELRQAIQAPQAVLFALVTGVPRETALDAQFAMAALPTPIRESGRQFDFIRKAGDDLACEEYALFVVLGRDVARVYGVKMHWNDLFWTLFAEIVHKLKLNEDKRLTDVPPSYRRFAKALLGDDNPLLAFLSMLAVFSATLAAAMFVLFRWF